MDVISILTQFCILGIATLAIYLIGFSIGRRSAYKDIDINYPLSVKTGGVRNLSWKPKSKPLIEAKSAN